MTAKAETNFANSVHKYLTPNVYAEKMHNPYRGGTPDFYFEGIGRSVWAEYKFVVLPKRADTYIVPNLSALQKDWLERNRQNGGAPVVIVGCEYGGRVFSNHTQWEMGMTCGEFVAGMKKRKELAALITGLVS
jgi:hypothetical protein